MLPLELDDILGREGYESMLNRLGGEDLAHQLDLQRDARIALQATLDETQRDLFITYADASSDAAGAREQHVAHAALAVGVALGAALGRFPDAPAEVVIQTAGGAVSAVVGADLPASVAVEIARVALDAARFDGAYMRL